MNEKEHSVASMDAMRKDWRNYALGVMAVAVALLILAALSASRWAYANGQADAQRVVAARNAQAANELADRIKHECAIGSSEGKVYRQTGLCRDAAVVEKKVSTPPDPRPTAASASCRNGNLVIVLSDGSVQSVRNARACDGPEFVQGPTVQVPGPTSTATVTAPAATVTATSFESVEVVVTETALVPGPTSTETATVTVTETVTVAPEPTATATETVPGPTATATATETVPGPTATATTTATATETVVAPIETVTVPPGKGHGRP